MSTPGPPAAPGPTFLVVGAARSGTTAVTEMLRRHPEVFVTSPKEPHFFAHEGERLAFTGPGDDVTVNRVGVTDPGRYLALYAGSERTPARGEGSVSTLYHARAAIDSIRRHAPRVDLVALLRDPVERAFSAYEYLRVRGFETVEDFDRALELEDERVAAGFHHMWHYRRMGCYGEQLAAFVEAFGEERVGVWFHDDLSADPSRTVGEICAHIGVRAGEPLGDDRPINTSGEPRSRLVQSVLRIPQQHPGLAAQVKRVVPYGWWHRLRARNLRPTEVPESARRRLEAHYADDLERLRRLLGHRRPLPPWLR